ncbi:TonB-dependent receptor [Cnuella takakiae]|uniref:TonB-dependent receptor n=1 Tax=Cnuella takakiae TaxID=1302690 RepID=UPI0009328B3E|nr:TonB-dependent receptor [Cnuella takakiae]OLY94635.1 hypothetical protein BUE76_03870 [Cnuella takakiae]
MQALFLLLLCTVLTSLQAQMTQQVRGTITDVVLQTPVAGATVSIPALHRQVTTDAQGSFRFADVPVGQQHLQVSHVGYKPLALDNINVIAGKETVLTLAMESLVHQERELVLRAAGKRNRPLNDMSAVSARAFTVEETQKYAASINDPLRMATGFPGVMAANDGNNDIIIRGNAPTGLLWRMEGVDIPNPNHFSQAGSSGGGISILSAQLLSNSDFVTGAFASEYGNALSGVFDLKLRKGNNEKREYSFQAGVLGLNAAAEGPIAAPFYKGSYVINYRYSTLQLLKKMGVEIAGGATNFQDLSYNIYLPTTNLGTFTVFGFGGLSSQDDEAETDPAKWEHSYDRYASRFISNTGMSGITHSMLLGSKTHLKSALAYSINRIGYNETHVEDDLSVVPSYKEAYTTRKLTFTTTANHRINNRHTLRAGAIVNRIGFNFYRLSKENPNADLKETINTDGGTQTVQGFAQWQYKPADNLTFNAGAHYLTLLLNRTAAVEPRASVKWDMSRRSSLAFGFGQHSQVQAMGVYLAQAADAEGKPVQPNKDLDLTKARHYVLSHQYALAKNLRLKTELYYQQLFNVPVSADPAKTFSTLNIQGDYITEALVNKGRGRNYGVEISLEKYLSNQFYYTLSNSLYQSKYTALDGVERNTRFNGGHISTLLMGKEFVRSNQRKTYGIHIKTIYAGGLRTTPIDVARSQQEGYTIFKEKEAFSLQNSPYFRTDLRLSIRWNRDRRTSTLSLDIQNLTNRLNAFNQWFDAEQGQVINNYQNGLIPVLNYKIEF